MEPAPLGAARAESQEEEEEEPERQHKHDHRALAERIDGLQRQFAEREQRVAQMGEQLGHLGPRLDKMSQDHQESVEALDFELQRLDGMLQGPAPSVEADMQNIFKEIDDFKDQLHGLSQAQIQGQADAHKVGMFQKELCQRVNDEMALLRGKVGGVTDMVNQFQKEEAKRKAEAERKAKEEDERKAEAEAERKAKEQEQKADRKFSRNFNNGVTYEQDGKEVTISAGSESTDSDLIGCITEELPTRIDELTFDCEDGEKFTDTLFQDLSKALPTTLTSLRLVFADSKNFTNTALQELAKKLPSDLNYLYLDFLNNQNFTDDAIRELAKNIPSGLTNLVFNFYANENFTDAAIRELLKAIPIGVSEPRLFFNTKYDSLMP